VHVEEGRLVCPMTIASDTTVGGSPEGQTLGFVSLQGATSNSLDPPKSRGG